MDMERDLQQAFEACCHQKRKRDLHPVPSKKATNAWPPLLQATAEKNAAVAQAEKTASKARLADRLISGLGGEFTRWSKNIEEFSVAEGMCL